MCVCLCVFACVCVFVQVCIATVCVRKDAGDRTAPTAAPVRTEAPAPRRTAPACARRDTEAPTADGVKKHNNTQYTHTHTFQHSAEEEETLNQRNDSAVKGFSVQVSDLCQTSATG